MQILRFLGALSFVISVALAALDAARSLKFGRFELTSLETSWTNVGGDGVFHMRLYFTDWFGSLADTILNLPVAVVAFGLGIGLFVVSNGTLRERKQDPPVI